MTASIKKKFLRHSLLGCRRMATLKSEPELAMLCVVAGWHPSLQVRILSAEGRLHRPFAEQMSGSGSGCGPG
jgi:hypothetical protein